MAESLILETSFLVDLEREALRGREGPAHSFLARHEGFHLHITQTIAGELAAGPGMTNRAAWEEFTAPFRLLPITEETCWRYGEVYRYLRRQGQLIGTNDLWIGATALAFGVPLVTANEAHFQRIPNLEVLTHRG